MIPTIDTNNYEEMWVSNYRGIDDLNNEIKEKIHFMCNGRACSILSDNNEIIRLRSWPFYRKIKKKYRPLSSTLEIPGWVFGFLCIMGTDGKTYLVDGILSEKMVTAWDTEHSGIKLSLEDLCNGRYRCSREIDGQQYTFKFYVECEE